MTTMTAARRRSGARRSRARRTGIRRPASGIGIDPAKLTWYRSEAGLSRQELSAAVCRRWAERHPDMLPFTHRKAVVSRRGGQYHVRYWDPAAGEDRQAGFGDRAAVRAFKTEADALLPRHEVVTDENGTVCTECGAPVTGGLTRDAIAKQENGERTPKPRTVRALCAALSAALGEPVVPRDLMPGGRRRPLPVPERERLARLEHNEALREFADMIGRQDLYRNDRGRISYKAELRRMYAESQADQAEAALAAEQAELAS